MKTLLILVTLGIVLTGGTVTFFYLEEGQVREQIVTEFPLLAGLFVGLCCATIANLFIRWLRWNFLTRRFGFLLQTKRSFLIYLAGLPMILTPLTVGEILRGYWLRKQSEHSWSYMGRIWLIERLADSCVLVAFIALAQGNYTLLVLWIGFACTVMLSLLHGTRDLQKSTPLGKFYTLMVLIISSVTAWMIAVAALYLVTLTLYETLPITVLMDVFAQGALLGGMSFLPGGVGVTGSSMSTLFEGYHVPYDKAVMTVMVFRAGSLWFAVMIGILVFMLYRKRLAEPQKEQEHFDAFDDYDDQIAHHMRDMLLEKKVNLMVKHLVQSDILEGTGIDIGCGVGHYADAMHKQGYTIMGYDQSTAQIVQCNRLHSNITAKVMQGDLHDVADESVDFVYVINVMHHVIDTEARALMWKEMIRVLKPSGMLMMHEINVQNPLFRLYMGYLFPLFKDIDEGTEEWIDPRYLPDLDGGKWQKEVGYFTFLPDFLPAIILTILQPIERRLEKSRWKHLSAHYFACFVKDKAPDMETKEA